MPRHKSGAGFRGGLAQLLVVIAIIAACSAVTLQALSQVTSQLEHLASCPTADTVRTAIRCEPGRS